MCLFGGSENSEIWSATKIEIPNLSCLSSNSLHGRNSASWIDRPEGWFSLSFTGLKSKWFISDRCARGMRIPTNADWTAERWKVPIWEMNLWVFKVFRTHWWTIRTEVVYFFWHCGRIRLRRKAQLGMTSSWPRRTWGYSACVLWASQSRHWSYQGNSSRGSPDLVRFRCLLWIRKDSSSP